MFLCALYEKKRLTAQIIQNSLIWCPISTTKFRSSRPEVFCKKGVLRNLTKFTGKCLCQGLFFNKVPVNFFEISKNIFLHRTLLVAAS